MVDEPLDLAQETSAHLPSGLYLIAPLDILLNNKTCGLTLFTGSIPGGILFLLHCS